jgi:hypothetical protein
MARDGEVDLLVGSTGAPRFIESVVFERSATPPGVRCDPALKPLVLEVDETQLRGSAVQGGYFLQPHGLKLTRGLSRIHLQPGHATRYEVSVDGNDVYRLRFLARGVALGERTLPDQPAGGLTLQRLEVPAAADTIEVEVSGGDGVASIGHLAPVP